MDRQIIYPGQVPLETDLLNTNRNTMTAIAKLCAALFGTSKTIVSGLAVTQTGVASMQVQVSPGEIYMLANLDGTAYSSLALDTTHQIVKQGISLDNVLLTCAAPGTGGFSINYLIQATFSETDGSPVVLPYYNASNPSTAYSGPANAGTTNNTKRQGLVMLSAKAGTAATTGTQTTPAPDAGYVGLAVVTVANGASSIVNGNISAYASAPVLPPAGIVVGGFQGNYFNIASAAGTADAITAIYTPGISALSNGMTLYLRAASANATTTPTFTPNSGVITPKNIVKGAASALAAGDIAGAGHWIGLQYDLSLDKWVLLNPATGVTSIATGYLLIQDQKASGTSGGSSAAGVQQRALTTTVRNTISGASLASNQVTLPAGTYRVNGFSVAASGTYHQAWLRNVTDATVAAQGESCNIYNAPSYGTSSSKFNGSFTIATSKVFDIQHFVAVAQAPNGLGVPTSSGQVEVYSTLEIIKES